MLSEQEDKVPFLSLTGENKLTLFPLMSSHKEAPSSDKSFQWVDMLHKSTVIDCPLEKWVHVGCEVSANYLRLHVNGLLVRERLLGSPFDDVLFQDNLKRITLIGNDGKLQGCVYGVEILPLSASIKDHYVKNPPVKLFIDDSCICDGVEEWGDGVWSIVGGKASCRRNFSLEVHLLDAIGRSVHKEMEIVALLLYADNGTTVEKTRDDIEAPLLISSDGLEFPSTDRPLTLLHGRATFKLKISQLSSKSDNRLFRVCFRALHVQRYPFFEAFSHPICCISRNRTSRTSGIVKRPYPCDETHSPNDGSVPLRDTYGDDQFQMLSLSEYRCSPSLKRLKIEQEKPSTIIDANGILEQDETAFRTSSGLKSNNFEGDDSAPSDSESTDTRNFESIWPREHIYPVSDATTFRYCLEGTHERSMLLKEIVTSAGNQDIETFADQVCLYAGCSHHRHQILISRQLLQEGADTWNSIPRNSHRVLWTDMAHEIHRRFLSISRTNRGLSDEDLKVLQEIGGCGDDLDRESFDRLWHWLYPVALAVSSDRLKAMWECSSPRWIEGLITRDEAENSLRGPQALQKPGTFVLRFPTSRSWPHPDAGSLVVTYVGADSTLHHKLVSLDLRERSSKLLQDLLLDEAELSQLGRITRNFLLT